MYHHLLLLLLLLQQGTRKTSGNWNLKIVCMGERKDFCHKVFNMWVSCVYYHHSRSASASLDGKAFCLSGVVHVLCVCESHHWIHNKLWVFFLVFCFLELKTSSTTIHSTIQFNIIERKSSKVKLFHGPSCNKRYLLGIFLWGQLVFLWGHYFLGFSFTWLR
jgi:hypothetical protein